MNFALLSSENITRIETMCKEKCIAELGCKPRRQVYVIEFYSV